MLQKVHGMRRVEVVQGKSMKRAADNILNPALNEKSMKRFQSAALKDETLSCRSKRWAFMDQENADKTNTGYRQRFCDNLYETDPTASCALHGGGRTARNQCGVIEEEGAASGHIQDHAFCVRLFCQTEFKGALRKSSSDAVPPIHFRQKIRVAILIEDEAC
jgi:hypothetical protein